MYMIEEKYCPSYCAEMQRISVWKRHRNGRGPGSKIELRMAEFSRGDRDARVTF